VLLVEVVLGILFLVACACALWLVPAWHVARHAEQKGHSSFMFLVAGLLVSWTISLIVALVVRARRTQYVAS
jgi:hypothetical protein